MTATLLPNGEQTFFDSNGNPLASGTVDFYIPASTTRKNTWQDANQITLNTNPVVLDAAGRAIIYGSGQYRQVVKDSLGNTIWDQLTQDVASLSALPLTVATYAAARALTGAQVLAAPGAIYIAGRATQNDGGEGFYVWNTTATNTDDGGFIIKLAAVVTGRLFRLSALQNGYLTPEMYGAVGDGSTDDATAMNAATVACRDNGLVLKLGTATYKMTAPWDCGGNGTAISIIGNGPQNSLVEFIMSPTNTKVGWDLTGVLGGYFRNFRVLGGTSTANCPIATALLGAVNS